MSNVIPMRTNEPEKYGEYTAHPVAAKFPLMKGQEFTDLVEDIRKRGLDNPIAVRGSMLLDGRNRIRACEKAGVRPRFVEKAGDEEEIIAFIVASNIHRRHLTAGQKAFLALAIEEDFVKAAKERMAAGGQKGGGDHTSAEAKARDKAIRAARSKSGPARSEDYSGRTDAQLGKMFNVSHGNISAARKIRDKDKTGLAEKVANGEMAINQAYTEVVKVHPTKQRQTKTPAKKHTPPSLTNVRFPPKYVEELKTKLAPLIKELKEHSKKNAATVSFTSLAILAGRFERLLDNWCQ